MTVNVLGRDPVTVDGKAIDYNALPEHMRDGMRRYMEDRLPPGGFLFAVLTNDFMGAAMRADDVNRQRLHEYALWLYHHAPSRSYGNPARVRAWLDGR